MITKTIPVKTKELVDASLEMVVDSDKTYYMASKVVEGGALHVIGPCGAGVTNSSPEIAEADLLRTINSNQ